MEPEKTEQPEKPKKGYGKRSTGQWVIIYIVGAIIVYGLIYLIFFRKGGSSSPY